MQENIKSNQRSKDHLIKRVAINRFTKKNFCLVINAVLFAQTRQFYFCLVMLLDLLIKRSGMNGDRS